LNGLRRQETGAWFKHYASYSHISEADMSAHDAVTVRTRATNEAVRDKRITGELAAPFKDSIYEWQVQFARIRLRKLAAHSNEEDRVQAQLDLGELLERVQHRRLAFERAIAGHIPRGSLTDLRKALARLTDQIAEELRS